jgi:hypothetical protein
MVSSKQPENIMSPPRTELRKNVWNERLERSGYFLGAVLLHLVLFLLIATWVVFKAPAPPPSDNFQAVTLKVVVPPPPMPPSSGAMANNPEFEPQSVVVPAVTPPSVVSTVNNSAFAIDSSRVLNQSLSHASDQLPQGAGQGPAGGGATSGVGSAFGSSTGSTAQLTGYFIDFKQTSNRQPTGMDEGKYLGLLAKYVSQGWDDSMFDLYYKSKTPLYTDAYAISTRPSEEAPKAFGLEKEVQPGLWVIHYHAGVQAPEAGNYRFAGFADNVMVVKIRGETVLDGGWDPLTNKAILRKLLPFALPSYLSSAGDSHDPHLKIGPTFHLDAADPVDMDVLIGDCGGVCSFFLLIEREGKTYQNMPDGTQKYPFFQISAKPAPTFPDSEEHPPYSNVSEPWSSVPN